MFDIFDYSPQLPGFQSPYIIILLKRLQAKWGVPAISARIFMPNAGKSALCPYHKYQIIHSMPGYRKFSWVNEKIAVTF